MLSAVEADSLKDAEKLSSLLRGWIYNKGTIYSPKFTVKRMGEHPVNLGLYIYRKVWLC